MEIVNYFDRPDQKELAEKIGKGDWAAARFLAKLLASGTFFDAVGTGGKLFLLLDGENVVSFVTLTRKDCIDDDNLYPWLGFFFTFPEYRGSRYGGKLLSYAVEDSKRQGYEKVYLATDHIGLYEKYGFSYLENRVDIYGEDSRIYVKGL